MLVICIDDVLSLFTEHEQAWDDSEVEVGVPLKEAPYMMVLEVTVDSVNELVTIERSRA